MTGEWNSLRSSIAQETLKDLFSLKQGNRILIFYLFVPTYFVYLFNNFFWGAHQTYFATRSYGFLLRHCSVSNTTENFRPYP
jgi:hypothetical protein